MVYTRLKNKYQINLNLLTLNKNNYEEIFLSDGTLHHGVEFAS